MQACKYIEEHLSIDTASLGKETLLNAAKTAMSSKIVDSESDFFAHMVVDAVQVRHSSFACAYVLWLTWQLDACNAVPARHVTETTLKACSLPSCRRPRWR